MKRQLFIIVATVGLLYGCIKVVDRLPAPEPYKPAEISAEEHARLQKCIELFKIKQEVLKEWSALPLGTSQQRTRLERKLVIITDGERICHLGGTGYEP